MTPMARCTADDMASTSSEMEEKLRAVLAAEKSQSGPQSAAVENDADENLVSRTAIDEHMTIPAVEKG